MLRKVCPTFSHSRSIRTASIAFCLSGLLILLIVSSACKRETQTTAEDSWFIKNQDVFVTNDVAKAQDQVPFAIVLPTYLPGGLGPMPYLITGSLNDISAPGPPPSVSIQYQTNGDHFVVIDEYNLPSYFVRSGENDFQVGEVTVAQSITESHSISGSQIDSLPTFRFQWGRDNSSFTVDVIGYSQDEAKRIVVSMIQ